MGSNLLICVCFRPFFMLQSVLPIKAEKRVTCGYEHLSFFYSVGALEKIGFG